MNSNNPPVTYWEYVGTDALLDLQRPLTEAHDEMQFIVVHQAFELWFKLAIYELRGAVAALEGGDHARAAHLLHRVATILRTSLHGFDPLMTMKQEGYAEFRDALAPASGFQSFQFRVMELLLGVEPVSDELGHERFYWETAVQAGITFTMFMEKYHAELLRIRAEQGGRTVRRMMSQAVEAATGAQGADAFRRISEDRESFPALARLVDAARDIEAAMLEFRKSHRRVTVFTVGANATGTSDSHGDPAPSCAAYLQGVIRERAVIFPEMHEAEAARER